MRIIDDKLFSDTVAYLDSRPHGEVVAGIANLRKTVDGKQLFEDLAVCLRSGKLQKSVPTSMMQADPAFAAFYQALTNRLKT